MMYFAGFTQGMALVILLGLPFMNNEIKIHVEKAVRFAKIDQDIKILNYPKLTGDEKLNCHYALKDEPEKIDHEPDRN